MFTAATISICCVIRASRGRIVKALDPADVVLVQHEGGELPMDGFFCRQVDRVGPGSDAASRADALFAGTAITSFEGRLESIDYRGLIWRGRLALAGAAAEIECVFDRSRGEDALNPFGNKTVCVTGRAIYTGDSRLPERIEVLTLEEVYRTPGPIDIQGSLAPASHADQENGLDHIQSAQSLPASDQAGMTSPRAIVMVAIWRSRPRWPAQVWS